MKLNENLFRNRLTFRAFLDVQKEIERFKWHAARDYHDAVHAAKQELAIVLLQEIGRDEMANSINTQLQESINRAAAAVQPRRKSRKKVEAAEVASENNDVPRFASRHRVARRKMAAVK